MDSMTPSEEKQAHVVCVAGPGQSHMKPLMKLAKLLHSRGILITFVINEFNHKLLLKSGAVFNSVPGFKLETIPDTSHLFKWKSNGGISALRETITNNVLPPFQIFLEKINAQTPPITSIVSDGFMTFTVDAARSLGVPIVLFWTISACAFMGCYQFQNLLQKGLIPLKDESYLTNGYMETVIDWIPGMPDIRLKDLPCNVRITDENDLEFNIIMEATQRARDATAHVLHTFDDLEQEVVNAISGTFRNVYTIGPQELLLNQIPTEQGDELQSITYNLWEEDKTCLEWLDSKETNSVLYVSFGSIKVMSAEQLVEFGWGLANSNHYFLWSIRPNLIVGDSKATLGVEYMEAIKKRGYISSWCPQEEVLNHVAVGGFLMHAGWNSILESLSAGVPMLCWPCFGDHTTICRYMCTKWECGMEIDNDVKRDDVKKLVRALMDGEEGKKMRNRAIEWKKMAQKACGADGSSTRNLDKLVSLLTN